MARLHQAVTTDGIPGKVVFGRRKGSEAVWGMITLLTGLYPSQHGAYSLGTKLMEDVPTVGDIFNEHGYQTALVGKPRA